MRPRMLDRLKQLPELRDVASDQQVQGLRAKLVFDRDTASRLGITAADHRPDAVRRLRPAAGLDHVHAVEPVPRRAGGGAAFQQKSVDLRDLFIRTGTGYPSGSTGRGCGRNSGTSAVGGGFEPSRATAAASTAAAAASSAASSTVFGGAAIASAAAFPNGGQVPLSAFSHLEQTTADRDQPPGTIPGGDAFVQPGAGRFAGRRGGCRQQAEAGSRHAAEHPGGVPGHGRRRSRRRWPTSRC